MAGILPPTKVSSNQLFQEYAIASKVMNTKITSTDHMIKSKKELKWQIADKNIYLQIFIWGQMKKMSLQSESKKKKIIEMLEHIGKIAVVGGKT